MNHEMDINNVCLLVYIYQAGIMFSFDVYVISHRILRINYYTKSTYLNIQLSLSFFNLLTK